jgi:Tol biopolymer transport system component
MGCIYEALDSRLDRMVALKVLPPDALFRPGLAERFSREALAASRLNHPNVATVLDFHTAPRPYIVTELVEGRTLRSRMPLTLAQAADVLRQLAAALAAVHRAGITHRDVKPENIMLRPDGLVKLIDFGLAQMPSRDAFKTDTGTIMGTYEYMAPEQMAGGETDARSDVWSFGIVADELVHGARPWKDIVRRCLERNPQNRFSDGAALLDAVNRPRYPHRRAVVVAGSVAGFGAVLGGAGLWRSRYSGITIRGMTRLTDLGDVLLAAVSPDGRFLAMACGFAGAQRLLVRHLPSGSDVVLVQPSPVEFTGVAMSPDGNFVFASYLAGKTIGSLWRYPSVGGDAVKVAEDVDSTVALERAGNRMVFVRGTRQDSRLVLVDSQSERILAKQPSENAFSFAGPAWSPDGKMIAVPAGLERMRILLADPVRGLVRTVPGKPANFIGRPVWHDNKNLVAPLSPSPGTPAQLRLLNVDTGKETALTNDVAGYFEPGVMSSGVITAMREEYFSYLSIVPGAQRVSFGREQFRYVRWAGPSRVVLTRAVADRYNLWTFDIASGRRVRLTENPWSERDPCWSQTARRFAAFSDRDGEWNLWSFDAEGRDWLQLTTGKTGGMNPEWTPDGRRLVFEATRDKIYGVWMVNIDGSGLRRLRPGLTRFPAVAPDGSLVACQYEQDKRWLLGTFRIETGELLHSFGECPLSASPRWQPDGRAVLWLQPNGRASELIVATAKTRAVRRLQDEGNIESFDVNEAGTIVYVTGIKQGDVVRLET